ncbi:hypothetical protein SS50377_22480 [Spironucleus salmonicida]|uniref:Uncharacterized protein n=1 Tax=Spironucleus salmonicida TaxID=348837 RepID=V6LC01_9EUKA|nr:hypothetical protein SS50377_22480 [Spironucleus salmonicida]|eukprot:EST42030.1 Hypothetical protein SS50377_18337 [Spironucleus salmonicida]
MTSDSEQNDEINAEQFFDSLNTIPQYLQNCAFKQKQKFKINNNSFALPQFNLVKIQSEFHRIQDKGIDPLSILLTKFPNVNDILHIKTYYMLDENKITSNLYSQFNYILMHYNIINAYPLFGFLLLSDEQFNYNAQKSTFIALIIRWSKQSQQFCENIFVKLYETVNIQQFIELLPAYQIIFGMVPHWAQKQCSEDDSDIEIESHVRSQIE